MESTTLSLFGAVLLMFATRFIILPNAVNRHVRVLKWCKLIPISVELSLRLLKRIVFIQSVSLLNKTDLRSYR